MNRIFSWNVSSKIESCTAARVSPLLRNVTTPVAIDQSETRPIANRSETTPIISRSCDVFINHRGADTKSNIAGLIHDCLSKFNIKAFLDQKTMKPGDKMFETIDSAIRDCKIGIALFSPRYCESYFCLHELTLMVESQKKVIPIFFDVKPSELRIDRSSGSQRQQERFTRALLETRFTVGLTFDSQKGNWPELVNKVGKIVVESLKEQGE